MCLRSSSLGSLREQIRDRHAGAIEFFLVSEHTNPLRVLPAARRVAKLKARQIDKPASQSVARMADAVL